MLYEVITKQFNVPLVAIEPMVKPASEQSRTKIITVCATPTTLGSDRYLELKRLYASGVKVIEPDCSDWSELIEHNSMNEKKLKDDRNNFV